MKTVPPISGIKRAAWKAAGLVCVALGIIGAVVPLMPSTTFFVLAAFCFARSSPRLRAAILNHPRIGPPVRRFLAHRVIPRPAKVMAGAMLIASTLALAFAHAPHWALALSAAITIAVMAYIVPKPIRAPDEAIS